MHSLCLVAELWKIQEHFEENNQQFCHSVRIIFIFWCYHADSVWVCTDLYNSNSRTQVNWLFSFMLFLESTFCIVWQFNMLFIDTLMAVYPSSWCGLSFSSWNIWSFNIFCLLFIKGRNRYYMHYWISLKVSTFANFCVKYGVNRE